MNINKVTSQRIYKGINRESAKHQLDRESAKCQIDRDRLKNIRSIACETLDRQYKILDR